jgi:glycosyltransferase involved in cell wall biosynthesis
MSNSLLEAMATGLPCVASGIGGNTDLITDGVHGRLVETPTPQAWSSALIQLLENPQAARALGAAARARIDREFALGVVVDGYVRLYRTLIDRQWADADPR